MNTSDLSPAPLIELTGISAGYDGREVLKDVNIAVYPQDFIGVIGPNGGGKTTLLKVMLGILKPMSGEVKFHCGKNFGYMPQINDIDLKFPISVRETVISGLLSRKGACGRFSRKDMEKADALIARYRLEKFRHRPIGELSGGQRQKVFLCRALISEPEILMLDEPTTFTDYNFEKEFYPLLAELNKEKAILMISHDIGTISSYVKTIACVNRGLHYHNSNLISYDELKAYGCPVDIISHGKIPHRVLNNH